MTGGREGKVFDRPNKVSDGLPKTVQKERRDRERLGDNAVGGKSRERRKMFDQRILGKRNDEKRREGRTMQA